MELGHVAFSPRDLPFCPLSGVPCLPVLLALRILVRWKPGFWLQSSPVAKIAPWVSAQGSRVVFCPLVSPKSSPWASGRELRDMAVGAV